MPDLANETLIPIQVVPDQSVFAGRKKRLTVNTIRNWMEGFRGVKLATITIGRDRYTSVQELQRFIRATNNLPKPMGRVRLTSAALSTIDPD